MPAEPTYATERSPDRYTDGPAVAKAIEEKIGRRPTLTQQLELDIGLERIDGPGSPFAYDEVIIIKGRRCGKTVTSFGVPHARALAGPIKLPNGRTLPFRAVHVAQNLMAARQRFDEDLVAPYRQHFTDVGWKAAAEYKRGAGDTSLTIDPRLVKNIDRAKLLRIASEIRVLAPSPSAARGAGVFHRTYDEELTYTLERGQQLQAAGRPTMAELFGQAQTWHISNVSVDVDARMFLWHQRESGRKAVLAGRRSGTCYIEYSLPPGVDPEDESEWWRYYPALSEGLVDIAQLRRDREVLEETNHDAGAAFFAEYLGRWADENETAVTGWEAIAREHFINAGVDDEQPADAHAAIGVEIDLYDRSASIFAVVDGEIGELIEHRTGPTDWVRGRVLELEPGVDAIGIDAHTPGNGNLVDQLKETPAEKKLVLTGFQEITAACFALDTGLRQQAISWRHNDYDADLTAAAAAAERTSGRAWVWERRVSVPQTPILAWTVALWALRHRPEQIADSRIF